MKKTPGCCAHCCVTNADDKALALFSEYLELLECEDFPGAEEVLAQLLVVSPHMEIKVHFEYGRMYVRWNKLSSALQHYLLAAEKAHQAQDFLLLAQINMEIKHARHQQKEQRP